MLFFSLKLKISDSSKKALESRCSVHFPKQLLRQVKTILCTGLIQLLNVT